MTKPTVKSILKRWKESGSEASFSMIERCFELKIGTLDSWLSGKEKPEVGALALLRIIDTYPWLLSTAASDFNEKAARCYLAIAGLDALKKAQLDKLNSK